MKARYIWGILVALCGIVVRADNDLLRQFYDDMAGRYAIFATAGSAYDSEKKEWKPTTKRCTTVISWVTAERMGGVIADHCVARTLTFEPGRFFIIYRGNKADVSVTDYRPQGASEVRIWVAPNVWGLKPVLDDVQASWRAGDSVFYCSHWPTTDFYDPVCAEGTMMAPGPAGEYESMLDGDVNGNMIWYGPTYWGFSGGPIYMQKEGKWALVGIVVAFSVFSNISFGWSVEPGLVEYVLAAKPVAPAEPEEPQREISDRHYPANFSEWDQDAQDRWRKALETNSLYILHYETEVGFFVEIAGYAYGFTDSLQVLRAIIDKKIQRQGSVLDVSWVEFVMEPR